MPSRTMILGARGFLGGRFRSVYPEASAPDLDVADPRAVAAALEAHRPEVVINCAGKTGRPNVDWCEDHPLETVRANVTGALVVMEECLRRGAYLVHLGSGCIYTGDNGGRGFAEGDPPNFSGSLYARTKATSEAVLRDFPVLVLRLRMPFDGSRDVRNLIVKLAGYPRVVTEPNSLTCLPDFLRAAGALIARRATGVWNVVNEGAVSPYEVVLRYRERVDPGHRVEPLSAADLPRVTRAPRSNCLLSTARLREAGLALPSVGEALERSLAELVPGGPVRRA